MAMGLTEHSLLGGQMHDAHRNFGVSYNCSAAPFAARHVPGVKQAARKTSGSVPLLLQLTHLARRVELLTRRPGKSGRSRVAAADDDDVSSSSDDDGGGDGGDIWRVLVSTGTPVTLAGLLQLCLNARDLDSAAVVFQLAEAASCKPSRAAAVAV
jgi:hypothetical protein